MEIFAVFASICLLRKGQSQQDDLVAIVGVDREIPDTRMCPSLDPEDVVKRWHAVGEGPCAF